MPHVKMTANYRVDGVDRRKGDVVQVAEFIAANLLSAGKAERVQAGYSGPTCRGSVALGTACGKCEKCRDELDALWQQPKPKPAPDAPVNRLKFASLVGKLDPKDPAFAEQVAKLNADCLKREELIIALRNRLRAAEVPMHNELFKLNLLTGGAVCDLLAALDATIERFVVDRY